MKKYKLVDTSDANIVSYDFVGFDDWIDFEKIMRFVRTRIEPERANYQGITDMHGYFDKDGLHVELEYDGAVGNWLEFKGERTEQNLSKVREWANLIFDELMLEVA